MASAAEQLAANISLSTFAKATELKKRLWFTLGALVLFRLLSFVPIPGIDPRALANLFQTQRVAVDEHVQWRIGGNHQLDGVRLCRRAHLIDDDLDQRDEVERIMRDLQVSPLDA